MRSPYTYNIVFSHACGNKFSEIMCKLKFTIEIICCRSLLFVADYVANNVANYVASYVASYVANYVANYVAKRVSSRVSYRGTMRAN